MADLTPRDIDAARALLRGLCRAYLDGGEAAVIAKLAHCCKAIDASDGAPEPTPPPPLPMSAITEEEIERHVNSILALGRTEGYRVVLSCAPSVYQNGLSDHYYAEAGDTDEGVPTPDTTYASLRASAANSEEASMVRVLAYRKNALVARATLIFTKAEGAPRKNSRGQYVIPLGKGAT